MAKMSSSTFTNTSPNWNKTGTEPPSSMKTNGFKAGYKPPAGYFNWFWTKVSKCITEIQNKINSIVSFLSADDFVLHKTVNITSTTDLNTLVANTDFRGGDFIMTINLSGAACTSFGFASAVEGQLRLSEAGAVLYFPSKGVWFYKTNSTNWTQKYPVVNLSAYNKIYKSGLVCNSLSQAYDFYNQYKEQYDVLYGYATGQLEMFTVDESGSIFMLDIRLGELTIAKSTRKWHVDTTNETFVEYGNPKHLYFGRSIYEATLQRSAAVNSQNTLGRLYLSGTDAVEYVDLESTEEATLINTDGASPSNTYYIQTWHKFDGTVIQRYKVGNGSWSEWSS